MGEAKRKKDAQREALKWRLLRECDIMDAPVTPFIKRVEEHVSTLDFYQIQRDPRARDFGFRGGECHANADCLEQNDPQRQIRAVRGWWLNGHKLISHSVISSRGILSCVTPVDGVPYELVSTLWFAVDPMITRNPVTGQFMIFGEVMPEMISLDRERDAQLSARIRSMLAEGADPYDLVALQ